MNRAIHLKCSRSLLSHLKNVQVNDTLLSVYLPADSSESRVDVEKRMSTLLGKSRRLLAMKMRRNDIEDFLSPVRDQLKNILKTGLQKGVAIFRSQNRIYSATLSEIPPEIAVVSDSYHIKPLVESSRFNIDGLIITITNRQLSCYAINDHSIYAKRVLHNDLDTIEENKRLGFVGQKPRNKELIDRFTRNKVRELGKVEILHHRNIAVMGSKFLRKKLIAELESQWKSHIFYQSEITPCLETMHKEVSDLLKTEQKFLETKLALEMQQTMEQKGLHSNDLNEIGAAAVAGRIATLFVDSRVQVWGHFDRMSGAVQTYEYQKNHIDQCIINDIVDMVLSQNGKVHFIDSKNNHTLEPHVAIFR